MRGTNWPPEAQNSQHPVRLEQNHSIDAAHVALLLERLRAEQVTLLQDLHNQVDQALARNQVLKQMQTLQIQRMQQQQMARESQLVQAIEQIKAKVDRLLAEATRHETASRSSGSNQPSMQAKASKAFQAWPSPQPQAHGTHAAQAHAARAQAAQAEALRQEAEDFEGDPRQPTRASALRKAIQQGDTEAALAILQHRCPPGLNVLRGEKTLLHMAITWNLPEVCIALLKLPQFQHVNKKRASSGITALHWAAFYGQVDVCQAILARPDFAELYAPIFQDGWHGCRLGDTALDVAKRRGHKEVAQLLETVSGMNPRASTGFTGGAGGNDAPDQDQEGQQGQEECI